MTQQKEKTEKEKTKKGKTEKLLSFKLRNKMFHLFLNTNTKLQSHIHIKYFSLKFALNKNHIKFFEYYFFSNDSFLHLRPIASRLTIFEMNIQPSALFHTTKYIFFKIVTLPCNGSNVK